MYTIHTVLVYIQTVLYVDTVLTTTSHLQHSTVQSTVQYILHTVIHTYIVHLGTEYSTVQYLGRSSSYSTVLHTTVPRYLGPRNRIIHTVLIGSSVHLSIS